MDFYASSRENLLRMRVVLIACLLISQSPAHERQEPGASAGENPHPLQRLLKSPGFDPSFTSLEALCIDSDNEPVAGVDISLVRLAGRNQGFALKPLASGVTDASGRYRFDGLHTLAEERKRDPLFARLWEQRLGLIAKKTGYASQFRNPSLGNLNSGIPMLPGARLVGSVTDQQGTLVIGARVWIRGNLTGMGQAEVKYLHSVSTDQQGRYSIEELPECDFERANLEARELAAAQGMAIPTDSCAVAVSHGRYAYGRALVRRIPSEVNVELKSGAAIEGRAVWSDGSPLVGATVLVETSGLRQPEQEIETHHLVTLLSLAQQAVTDDQGRYRFDAVPLASYRISLCLETSYHRGTPRHVFHKQFVKLDCGVAGQTEHAPDLRVSAGRLLTVRLVNGETREPLVSDQPLIAQARYTPAEEGRPVVRYDSVSCPPGGLLKLRVPEAPGRLSLKLRLRDEPDPRKVYLSLQPEAIEVPSGRSDGSESILICPVSLPAE